MANIKRIPEARVGLPVRHVIITHYHPDHVLGAQAFDCEIVCSRATMDLLRDSMLSGEDLLQRAENEKSSHPDLWESAQSYRPRLPDRTFDTRITLGDDDEIEILLQGGHTSGSSIVIHDDSGVCFAGDLVFQGEFPYAGDPTCDPLRWIAAYHSTGARRYL